MTAPLARLAGAVGLQGRWIDNDGQERRVEPEILARLLIGMGFACDSDRQIAESLAHLEELEQQRPLLTAEVGLPLALPPAMAPPARARLVLEDGEARDIVLRQGTDGRFLLPPMEQPGYHRLEIGDTALLLAVAPKRAPSLDELAHGRRIWGPAVQIYALRQRADATFGDFAALADFAATAAAQGADAVAINPVHALFAADPSRYSPYAPSSRLFLNVLYGSPSLVLGGVDGASAGPADELIAWPGASAGKLDHLRQAHRAFTESASPSLREDFERFRREGGQALERHARFEALHAHLLPQSGPGGWCAWPAALQDPGSAAVAAFATEQQAAVSFHVFLQWLADRSLAAAQARAKGAGMALGLIGDLAVGTAGDGSDAWAQRGALLTGATVGAPPDLINDQGQSWGLTAFSPLAMTAQGFAPFLGILRAALRHAGGLRIDHILGLSRLWLVPEGASATQGAYLTYPFRDLLRLVALEAHRHRALVIGEDLGTVPDGFRETLREAGIPGLAVLLFERDAEGRFIAPRDWARDRVAMTTTHDLPTLAGWWKGRDIAWAEQLGYPGTAKRRAARVPERRQLWKACKTAGCAKGEPPPIARPEALVDAAVDFLARTPARLAILPLEDLIGMDEQPNLPGTIDEHPNWRRRLPADAATLFAAPATARRINSLRQARSTP